MFFQRDIFILSLDQSSNDDGNDDDDDEENVGGLFRISQKKKLNANDVEDYTLIDVNEENDPKKRHDWDLEEVCELIRDCFVTGKWEKEKDAEHLLAEDDAIGDDEDDGQ